MPPKKSAKTNDPKKAPETPPVDVALLDLSMPLEPRCITPPPIYHPVDDAAIIHPACICYMRSATGHITWNASKVTPPLLGEPWIKKQGFSVTDSRLIHPSSIGYHVLYAGSIDESKYSPEKITPVFAVTMYKNADPVQIPRTAPPVDSKAPLHHFVPLESISSNSKYLEEHVWPLLTPAIEKTLRAMKLYIPKSRKSTYKTPLEAIRTLHPEDVGPLFNPINLLANHLRRCNPKKPLKENELFAVIVLQRAIRKYIHRNKLKARQLQANLQRLAEEEAAKRAYAATLIQSFYRGYRCRVHISVGKAEFVLGRVR